MAGVATQDKPIMKHAPTISREMRSSSGRLLQSDPYVVNRVWNDGSNRSGSSRDLYLSMYQKERAPWDLGRPQLAVVSAQALGFFNGRILDLGFALGDNAIFLAQKGHSVVGIDLSPEAVDDANARLQAVGRPATELCDFRVGDCLRVDEFVNADDRFDTLLDFGLFHSFSDEQQEQYIAAFTPFARKGAQLVLVCFSDENPGDGWHGPRRLSKDHIRVMLSRERGWRVDNISNTRIENNPVFEARSNWTGRSIGHFVVATRI